jgi:hypothetical protein
VIGRSPDSRSTKPKIDRDFAAFLVLPHGVNTSVIIAASL